jgi:hypothetical protein
MDDLSLNGIPPKRSQSGGIANLVAQPQELGLHQKPPNQSPFHGFGGRSPRKRHHVLMRDSHYKSRRRSHEISSKNTSENPKKHRD